MIIGYRKIVVLLAGLLFLSMPVSAQENREIWVQSISFNWTSDFPKNMDIDLYDAINIRQNPFAGGVYPVPEYAPGLGRRDVPAAYYAGEKDVAIKVVFATSDQSSFTCRIQGRALGSNKILGNTTIEQVSFAGGASDEILFTVPDTIPRRLCQSRESWQWVGVEDDALHQLCLTEHVIYCLPGYPQTPWQCTGTSASAPWIDLLDMILAWMPDKSSVNPKDTDILKSLTIGVYALGDPNLPNHKIYESWNTRGGFHYNLPLYLVGYLKFDLWAVMDMSGVSFKNKRYNRSLDRLSTKTSSNRYVDCSDVSGLLYCAASLAGIENVNIQTISVDNDPLGRWRFYYRQIQPIGMTKIIGYVPHEPASPSKGDWWNSHQVVSYLDPVDDTRYIYDPCLKFITDGKVEKEPPIHMRYQDYQAKLFHEKYDKGLPGFVWDKPTKVINEIASLPLFPRP